jgi:hypothetical protein
VVVLVVVVFDRCGCGPDWIDFPMNCAEVDGCREVFLDPGGWMKKFCDMSLDRILLVVVEQWRGEIVDAVSRSST